MLLALIDAIPIVIALVTIRGLFRYLTSRNDNTTLMRLATFVGPERTPEMIRHYRHANGIPQHPGPDPITHIRGNVDDDEDEALPNPQGSWT